MATKIPIQFNLLNFSLKNRTLANTESKTIPILLIPNTRELSIPENCRAWIKKYKEPKLNNPKRTPPIRSFPLKSNPLFDWNKSFERMLVEKAITNK